MPRNWDLRVAMEIGEGLEVALPTITTEPRLVEKRSCVTHLLVCPGNSDSTLVSNGALGTLSKAFLKPMNVVCEIRQSI